MPYRTPNIPSEFMYFMYTDYNQVECYLELNNEFYCERVVFMSTTYESTSSYYYDGPYVMPDESQEEEIKSMTEISQEVFEEQWAKVYTKENEITFLLKYAEIKREDS